MRSTALVASLGMTIVACGPSSRPVPMPPPVHVPVGPVAEPVAPPAPAVHAEKVRELEGITEYRLPNGLQILLFPDQTSSTVTVNITYFVGSRHEGYGETGMAHLLEHMTFKGTTHYGELLAAMEGRGAFPNGSTWTDRTNYFATLPAGDDNLTFALDVEAERMTQSLLEAEDLATEFSVVRSEFEIGENDPGAVLEERVTSTAYLWHNYGKSTIGSRSDIERVPVSALRAFYEKYYQPDNAMLVVSGKLELDATLAEIERIFGPIPKPERVLDGGYTVEPIQDGARTVTLERAGEVHIRMAAYHTVAGSDPDWPALECAADLLTRTPTGRLYAPLLKSKLASSVRSSSYAFRDPGLMTFTIEARTAKDADKAGQKLLAAVEGLGDTTITDAEVNRWRNHTLADLARASADTAAFAIELSEWAALGDWRLRFAYRDQVEAVTAADVQRVASTWFKASNRTWGEFVPTKDADRAPLPTTPDVKAIADKVEGKPVREGEVFVASLDNLIARTTTASLAGGIDAMLLPKKTRGGTVRLVLTLHHGDLKSLEGKALLGTAAASLAMRGTKKHSFQELEDEQARLQADISVAGGASSITIQIETVSESLLEAIALAAEMVQQPSFPADELEVVRERALAWIEDQRHDPYAVGFAAVNQAIAPYAKGDPRRSLTFDEQLAIWKKLKVKDLAAFQKAFWGAGTGELVVIGDFESAAVTAAIEAQFGTWTTKHAWTRLPEQRFGNAAAEQKIDLKDKEMAILAIGHDLDLQETDADYAAADMAGYLLGGPLSSRMWTRLREQEGFSYGTAAWLYASRFDRVGRFGGFAVMAPQNLDAGRAAMLEELQRFIDDGPTADELDRTRTTWLETQNNTLADDGLLVWTLQDLLSEGRTLADLEADRAAVRALTVDQVKAAAKKYLAPDRLVIVEAGDFARGAAAATD